MPASRHDITVEADSTFELPVDVVDDNGDPVDLTGYTGSMQIRATYDATDVLATATVTIADNGRVMAVISATDTGAATWTSGVYDLVITNNTRTERIVQGDVRLSRSVTR